MITINRTKNVKDLNKLNQEAKSHNIKILYVVKFGDNNLRFTLSESLTSEEETTLDSFLDSFVDVDIDQKVPKIYGITKSHARGKHFHTINYKSVDLTQSLIPKRTVIQGEVRKVDWYKSLNQSGQPEDKVLCVEIDYNRDPTGFAISRTTTRTWMNLDDTPNEETKVTTKYYYVNPSDQIDEGLKRRSLLVKSLQFPVMQAMMEVLMPLGYTQSSVVLQGRTFLDDYEDSFSKFIENSSSINDPASPDFGKKTVVARIEQENKPEYITWLDSAPPVFGGSMTIRQYLVAEFSI